MSERIGRETPTSVYRFPKKTNQGKILYYKSLDAFGTGASKEYLDSINPFPEGSPEQKAFIKDLEKQFKYPLNSTAAKEAGVLGKKELAKKHGITFKQVTLQTEKYKKRKNLEYPSQPYEGKAYKKFKQKERRQFITETSLPKKERDISKLYSKKGKFELAHRASLKQLVKLGVDYPLESLGFDTRNVNQELVKPFEKALESIYKKQNLIADKYKGKTIPKTEQLKISAFNNDITDLIEKSDRNLNGVLMDEKTGKFSNIYGQEAVKAPGAGFADDTVKKTTTGDLNVIGKNVKEQRKFATKSEKNFVNKLKLLYDNEPEDSPVRKALDNKNITKSTLSKIVNAFDKGGKLGLAAVIGTGAINLAGELVGTAKASEPSITYNPEIGAIVKSGTDDIESQSKILNWIKDNPMKSLAGTATVATKVGRGLLMNVLGTLGTPAVGGLLAGSTIARNLIEGEDLADATIDKEVGAELLLTGGLNKAFGSTRLASLLGGAKLARSLTPVGAGITALGLGKDYINFAAGEIDRINDMKENDPEAYEAYKAEEEEQMGISA
tara:strand:- start:392 stop:2053 length:1662 start_codon:yes stop_codon:yes gene_type:complete